MKLVAATALAILLAQPALAESRDVPAKSIPVPDTVSPQMQAIIAQPYNPNWSVVPKTPAEWKAIVDKSAAAVVATLPEIRDKLGVTVQPTTIAGVKAFIVTPKTAEAKNVGIFGTSTGGGMTLAMVLRTKLEHLPLPGAIAPGTPWSDMTKTGDSFFANEMLDNVLVSDDGFLHAAALLYANGHDLKDPLLPPVYGDMHGFPPTILTSGTRDLFLSNTVRVHRKLREAGVEAELQVFEGQSHAQYYRDINAPETKEYNMEVAGFFDRHLGK